ncbi:MAG: hypothetical protein EOP45_07485 [Sphingobacteriaceae bacterium]|nr:MAG: hypothetical protein EOP45_07485 [Sphingobacteriaceae bacterium]
MYKKIPNRQTKNNTCTRYQPFSLTLKQQLCQKMQPLKPLPQKQQYLQSIKTTQFYPMAGVPGLPGLPGKDGSFIISGSGAPPTVIGKFGDMYIDNSSGDYYVKDSTGWSIKSNLRGPQGENGSKIIVESGQPHDSIGADNDLYINNENGNYYTKVSGSWNFEGDLQSGNNLTSSTITAGYGVPDDSDGEYGDFYLDRNTGLLYYKDYENSNPNNRQQGETFGANNLNLGETAVWTKTGTIKASLVQTGSNNPLNSQGNINDFYINTSTGAYFSKSSTGWNQVGKFQISTQSMSNNYTISNSDIYTNDNDTTQRLTFSVNGSSNSITTLESTQTQNRTIILPDADDTLIGKSTTDVLSNKSFSTSVMVSDNTPSINTTTGAVVVDGGIGIGGDLNVGGSISATNLTGINTGDVVIGPFNLNSTTNGATVTNQIISLSAANATNPGAVSTTAQIFKGIKTFQDGFRGKFINANFVDINDNTKTMVVDTSSSTTSTATTLKAIQTANRIITLPDLTDTLVGQNTIDTLNNKTLSAPTINNPVLNNGGILTLPTSADMLIGRATTDTLTNKTLLTPTINNPIINNGGVLTLPTSADTLVGRTTTDTLLNKNLSDSSTVIINAVDSSKILAFNLSNTTTGKTTTLSTSNTVNRTITFPDATDTLVGKVTVDTLTNKTLTAPTINNPVLNNGGVLSLPTSTDTLIGRATTDILTNKTLTAPIINNPVLNNGGVLNLPTSTDTLIGRATTDTLTNKTLTAPIINNPVLNNGGLLTLPTSADTLIGRSTTDVLSNKSFSTAVNISSNTASTNDTTGALTVSGGVGVGGNLNIAGNISAANFSAITINPVATTSNTNGATTSGQSITLTPADATNPGFVSTTNQTINGLKTFQSGLIGNHVNAAFVDSSDTTKVIVVDTSGATTGTTTTLKTTQSANRTVFLPNTNDILIGRVTLDTVANKTFIDNSTFICNNTDTTKTLNFLLNGTTTGKTQ